MKHLTTLTFAATLAATTQAHAETSTFANDLSSRLLVSPAQTYQVDGNSNSALLSTGKAFTKSKVDGMSGVGYNTTDAGLGIRSVSTIPGVAGLRLGLAAHLDRSYFESNSIPMFGKYTQHSEQWTVSPEVSYTLGMVVFGFAYDYTKQSLDQSKFANREASDASAHWNTYRPGILFKTNTMEVGVTYSSPTYESPSSAASKDLTIAEPAMVTAHGRVGLTDQIAVGAMVVDKMYASHSDEMLYDQLTTRATLELKLAGFKLDSYAGIASHYYRSKANMTGDNITKELLGADALFVLSPSSHVGVGLELASGSDSGESTSQQVTEAQVRVMGGISF